MRYLNKMQSITLKKQNLFLAFISITVFFAYFGLHDNYFYRDDTSAFYAGHMLYKNIANLFILDFDSINMSGFKRYLVILSYLPNYIIGGIDPKNYYTTNILIHIINSILVFLVTKRISKNEFMPYLCTILFAISQDRADAIMMVSHRTTLLGAFSSLFLCWLYLFISSNKNNILKYIFYLIIYTTVIFTYETSIMLPFSILLLTCFFLEKSRIDKFVVSVNIYIFSLSAFLVFFLELSPRMDFGHQIRNLFAALPSILIPTKILQESQTPDFSPAYLHSYGSNYGLIEFFGILLFVIILVSGIKQRNRLMLFGLAFYLIFAYPSSSHLWAYYPDWSSNFVDNGTMRWSIGKFTYLASFGSSIILSTFIIFICKNLSFDKRYLNIAASTTILFIFFGYSIYFIKERESTWHNITNANRKIIEYILNKKEILSKLEFVTEAPFLRKQHLENLLIVVTNNTEMKVLSQEDYLRLIATNEIHKKNYGIFYSRNNKVFFKEFIQNNN